MLKKNFFTRLKGERQIIIIKEQSQKSPPGQIYLGFFP